MKPRYTGAVYRHTNIWLSRQFHVTRRLRFKGGSPGAQLLVEQLRDFPNADHDDGPDAPEMAVRLAVQIEAEAEQPAEVEYYFIDP